MPAKEALILVPGLLCDDALWQYQLTALREFADPVVADVTGASSIAELARRVLDSAPPRFALAGLSMGGYVSFEIWRQAPERVTRLALLDTSARADTDETRARRQDLIELAQRGRFKGVTPRLLPLLVHPRHLGGPIAAVATEMAERVGQAAFVRQEMAIMGRIDSRPTLPTISVPSLVLCGEDDQLTPPDLAREMAAGIPAAELEIVSDCGHLSTLERPEAVNRALIGWLAAG
ncbi:MAG TPA: alpha/beta fold hydrolase [Aliidongia sp.]|nr:alpha/beta fold hydrolase [Aliidongia sp.]